MNSAIAEYIIRPPAAISENSIGSRKKHGTLESAEGTVSGDIDNDAEMKLIGYPNKNLVSSLANIFGLFHCIQTAIPISNIAVFTIVLTND